LRFTRSAALSGLIIVALVALGIAAFTPRPNPEPVPSTYTALMLPEEPGRVAGAIVGSPLRARTVSAPQLSTLIGYDPQAEAIDPRSTTTTVPPPQTSTTAAPVQSTQAAATSTPTTTTTAAAVPETTTTVPPEPVTTTTLPPGGAVERWRPLVAAYFPAGLVDQALSVIDCESNGNPAAIGPGGASGLFQFIPSTWASASANAGFEGASALDPTANVASAAYLVQASIDSGSSAWGPWGCKP
jgi:hypothetical protein